MSSDSAGVIECGNKKTLTHLSDVGSSTTESLGKLIVNSIGTIVSLITCVLNILYPKFSPVYLLVYPPPLGPLFNILIPQYVSGSGGWLFATVQLRLGDLS